LIRTPPSVKTGTVMGEISCTFSLGGASITAVSRFQFEYYQDLVLWGMEPQKATLRGKTTSKDGDSVLLTIKNAPKVSSAAADFTISFGNVECGQGSKCSIKSIRSSKQDGANFVFLQLKVPTWPRPGDASITVTAAAAPGRQARSVSSSFSFYQPLPSALSARWCNICKENSRTCIVMGRCGDKSEPLIDLLPLSGGGTVTVLVKDPPAIVFNKADGSSSDMIGLALGDSSYGTFKRVAYGNGATHGDKIVNSTLIAVEFDIPDLYSADAEQMEISMHPSEALAPSLASLAFAFFDDDISMVCLENCQSPEGGITGMVVSLTNFPMDLETAPSDQLFARFGQFDAVSIAWAGSHQNCTNEHTCLELTSPACVDCIFPQGHLDLALSVGLKADPSRGANIQIAYFSAPVITSAMMDTVGSSINVIFDQRTDMGGMSSEDADCSLILHDVSSLGSLPMCVWEEADSLNVFLGTGLDPRRYV
jgi:hypothetical protein